MLMVPLTVPWEGRVSTVTSTPVEPRKKEVTTSLLVALKTVGRLAVNPIVNRQGRTSVMSFIRGMSALSV
jgi:hypothetical protein